MAIWRIAPCALRVLAQAVGIFCSTAPGSSTCPAAVHFTRGSLWGEVQLREERSAQISSFR